MKLRTTKEQCGAAIVMACIVIEPLEPRQILRDMLADLDTVLAALKVAREALETIALRASLRPPLMDESTAQIAGAALAASEVEE